MKSAKISGCLWKVPQNATDIAQRYSVRNKLAKIPSKTSDRSVARVPFAVISLPPVKSFTDPILTVDTSLYVNMAHHGWETEASRLSGNKPLEDWWGAGVDDSWRGDLKEGRLIEKCAWCFCMLHHWSQEHQSFGIRLTSNGTSCLQNTSQGHMAYGLLAWLITYLTCLSPLGLSTIHLTLKLSTMDIAACACWLRDGLPRIRIDSTLLLRCDEILSWWSCSSTHHVHFELVGYLWTCRQQSYVSTFSPGYDVSSNVFIVQGYQVSLAAKLRCSACSSCGCKKPSRLLPQRHQGWFWQHTVSSVEGEQRQRQHTSHP